MKSKALNALSAWMKKNKKIAVVLAVGILGMLLIFASGLDSGGKASKKSESRADTAAQETYEKQTEEKLKSFVESIEGAGRAEVMITFESSGESVFARDMSEDTQKASQENSRKTEDKYVIVESDGNESGLLTKAVYPKVRGVAVCCDGASDSVIRQRITEAVSALFDINSTNISVVRRAGQPKGEE